MCIKSIILFLCIFGCFYCYGQQAQEKTTKLKPLNHNKKATNDVNIDPYKNKPFKPGDIRKLQLTIPIGNITLNYTITYTLLEDPDGMFYQYDQRYKAEINTVIPTGESKYSIPQALTDGFTDKEVIELTETEIKCKKMRVTNMYYWFVVRDFNLDGKADIAFIGDLGYHSSPVNYDVWVNLNHQLVYWNNISGVPSFIIDNKKRIIEVLSNENDSTVPKYYIIEKDTSLVPLHAWEANN